MEISHIISFAILSIYIESKTKNERYSSGNKIFCSLKGGSIFISVELE
jgi:hypothetical protein